MVLEGPEAKRTCDHLVTASRGHIPPGWSCRSEVEGKPSHPLSHTPTPEARPGVSGHAVLCRRDGWHDPSVRRCIGASQLPLLLLLLLTLC